MDPTRSTAPTLIVPRPIRTVLGEVAYDRFGITDAHNHVWIEPVPGANPANPVLDRYPEIRAELELYRAAGGQSLLDCQPQGCGRDANRLASLARETGVYIAASTGFHREIYYPPNAPIFAMQAGQVAEFLLRELEVSLKETEDSPTPVRAGFIKIALEKTWAETPLRALEGAAAAAHQTGALLEIHTEKGALAEKALVYLESQGVAPRQIVFCHMDKRPIFSLHAELARYGVLLEYDTFFRPKYDPETNVWPLVRQMAAAGLSASLALATDMGGPDLYQTLGSGPGLAGLPVQIRQHLRQMGLSEDEVRQMLGANIARRLAGFNN